MLEDHLKPNVGISGYPPWQYNSRDQRKLFEHSNLHYRGWTLVDCGRTHYASKDGTTTRLRICRTSTRKDEALQAFRTAVDGWEDSHDER